MTSEAPPGFFDRERIASGRGPSRRRGTMLYLLESWSSADSEVGSDVLEFLASTDVFGALPSTTLRELFAYLEPVHVGAGEVVLDPTRAADALHLVGHGRLAVTSGDGEREVGPGQVVGAGALLDDVPPGTRVRAVRDSLLLKLGATAFRRFAEEHPSALLGLCRALVRAAAPVSGAQAPGAQPAGPVPVPGTVAASAAPARTGSTIAVLAAGASEVPDAIVTGLVEALGPATEVSAALVDGQLGSDAAQTGLDDPRNGRLVGWLHRLEQAHQVVVYRADPGDTAWTRRCLRQADRVLLLAVAGADTTPGPAERALLGAPGRPRRDLVVVHPPGITPTGTAEWLDGREIVRHHHVRRDRPRDLARVARFLGGTARGLVLAGGGMRGFAHLGVMQALDEAGIEIDAVGGSSIGAIMGGWYAAGLDHEHRVRAATASMVEQGSMVGFTLPLVAVSSGRKVTRLLRDEPAFGGTIEDLWLPYFCVSASLSAARQVVHDRGSTWQAIRASIAIPGVYPPVHAGTELLVDGGTINNLPVDVMDDVIGNGSVVAVNLHRSGGDRRPPPKFELSVSGWQVLASRLNPFRPAIPVPRLPDVLMRSMALSTARAQRDRLAHRPIEHFLTPPVGRAGMLDFAAGPALIEPAYRYTVEALEQAAVRA